MRGSARTRSSDGPGLDAGRTYQLWGLVGQDLVSLGVLGADPDIVTFRADGVSLLAVTAETAGGVVRSEQEPVVSGRLA